MSARTGLGRATMQLTDIRFTARLDAGITCAACMADLTSYVHLDDKRFTMTIEPCSKCEGLK